MPLLPRADHDEKTFLCFSVHFSDLFGLILEVAVHHHHPLATACRESGCNRGILSEIPRKIETADTSVFCRQVLNPLPGIVGARVVHENNLKGRIDTLERRL